MLFRSKGSTVPATTSKAAPAKKGTKPAPATPATTVGRSKKEGLRNPQVRILLCLQKNPKGLTRKELSAQAPVDNAFCTEYLGATSDEIRFKNDTKPTGFPSLLTLGFISRETHADESGTIYKITTVGREAAVAAAKAAAAKPATPEKATATTSAKPAPGKKTTAPAKTVKK